MNTEQFIRDSAARGLSRRATMHALGIGPWKFRELLTLMPEITWPARGCSADHQRANEQKRGRCTPAQAAALERAGVVRGLVIELDAGGTLQLVEQVPDDFRPWRWA
ncbi:hypothetical protein F3G48_30095 [Pseudomonas aeruginosa]|nr:hypothetical protein F3G48_30095 [Pseudomonas aeruginosa]